MTDEVELLKSNGVDSIQLAIEMFNKPREGGRQHGVLIFVNHGLELLLKGAILERGGTIWESEDGHTRSRVHARAQVFLALCLRLVDTITNYERGDNPGSTVITV